MEFLGFAQYVLSGDVVAFGFDVYYIFEEGFSVEDYVKFTHFCFRPFEGYIILVIRNLFANHLVCITVDPAVGIAEFGIISQGIKLRT